MAEATVAQPSTPSGNRFQFRPASERMYTYWDGAFPMHVASCIAIKVGHETFSTSTAPKAVISSLI